MTISSISQLVESPLFAKLLALTFIAVLFLYLRRKDTEGHSAAFLASVSFLAIRDLLYALYPMADIFYISDIIYFCFALYIFMAPCKVARPAMFPAILLNIAVALFYTLHKVMNIAPGLPFWPFLTLPVLDGLLIGVFAFIRRKVRKESVARQIVGRIWPLSVPVLLAYALAGLFLGYENDLFQRVIAPLSYGWYIAGALAALSIHDSQILSAVNYYEGSIDSLYNLFLNTGTAFKRDFSTEEVLKSLNDAMVAETGADGGVIFLVDEFDDLIVCKTYGGSYPPPVILPESLPRKVNRVESFMKHIQFRLGEGVFGDVAKTGKNIYIPDVSQDPRIVVNGEEDYLRLSSFIAVPLMVEDKIIGVASVVRKDRGRPFSEEEFDRCKLLANFGTLAVSNYFTFIKANEQSGLEQSADIAADIQRSIIPKKIPQYPGLGLGAFSLPARGVSGDYFDIIQTRSERVVCVIGDVAGKGVSAALIMVMIRAILHLITNTNKDIATVLNWVNKGITGKIDLDHYATLSIVAVNTITGEVEYANASHQALLLYRRASDNLETLDIKSVPIGVERSTEYARKALRLSDGDILVMYTDGIVEAMNEQGKQYGRKGLSQVVIKNRDLAPKDIVAKIKSDLSAFVGEVRQHDDQTVLVLKMKI